MAIDVLVVQHMIDLLGNMEYYVFLSLDSVKLVSVSGTNWSVLDAILIGGFVFDVAWDIIDELRP